MTYAGVALLVVAAWLFGMVYWERATSTAREIRLVDPPATATVSMAPGNSIALAGRDARMCTAHPGHLGGVDASGEFELSTQLPKPSFGERLVWAGFECMDGSSTRFARTIVALQGKSGASDAHVEVFRVGMDFRQVETWLEAELRDIVYRIAVDQVEYDGTYGAGRTCPSLPRRNQDGFLPENKDLMDEKCGLDLPLSDQYATVDEVGEPQFTLNVSDGFAIDIVLPLKVRFRETNCLWGPCSEDQYRWVNVEWELRVVAIETRRDRDEPIKLTFDTRDSRLNTGNPLFNLFVKVFVEGDLFDRLRSELESRSSNLVRRTVDWFRDRTSDEFLAFLTNDSESAKRIARAVGAPERLGLARVDVERSGATLYFSLTVPNDWVGVEASAPDLALVGTGDAVSLTVSYFLVNRILEALLGDRHLSEVLVELRTMLQLAGAVEADAFDDMVADAKELSRHWGTFLEYADLRFNQSLDFALPLRVRPASERETRVFFGHAQVLSTVATAEDSTVNATRSHASTPVPIGFSAEGRVAFGRSASEVDVRFLLDHVAFEPLVSGRDTQGQVDLYYGLTPLFRKIVEWDRAGELEGEDLGRGVAELRSSLLWILHLASLKEHTPIELELYVTEPRPGGRSGRRATVATVDLVQNDVVQNALLVRGDIGYSRAGAVYATQDLKHWGLSYDRVDVREATRAAKSRCERRRKPCSRLLVFHRATVAAAQSYDGRYHFGKGANSEQAKAAALARCARAGGEGCTVPMARFWANTEL